MAIYSPFTDYLPPLRRGDKGIEVSALQRALRDIGRSTFTFEYTTVSDTGVFDLATETAVKALQRTWNLRVDGIADRDVQRAVYLSQTTVGRFHDLSVLSDSRIQHILSTLGGSFQNFSEMPQMSKGRKASYLGRKWMFWAETGNVTEITAYLHYPGKPDVGNNSGVTLGPGYDLGQRDADVIEKELISIGVDKLVAEQVSHAGRLTGLPAEAFAEKYGAKGSKLIHLDAEAQFRLQAVYLVAAEYVVNKLLSVPLLQREFDALVSVANNAAPGNMLSVIRPLNQGHVGAALQAILNKLPNVHSSVYKGIGNRRRHEVEWFLTERHTYA